jgi:transcriptional regulator with XRE-family HTH domain
MARAALEIGVRDLAEIAGVSAMTVTRFENGKSAGYPETLAKLKSALEEAGVEFIPENGGGAGVRLRKRDDQPTIGVPPTVEEKGDVIGEP